MQQQFRDTCVRLVHFREVTDVDCPKAMAQLERMLRALEAYRELSGPRPAGPEASNSGGASVARQDNDQPEASPPAAPESAGSDPA